MSNASPNVLSEDGLAEARIWARGWLFESALPIWWQIGADHVDGGFHEKIDQQGQAVGVPTRLRVQARQIYVFAEAGRIGWSGPWLKAMRHGLSFMLEHYQRGDGLFRSNRDQSDGNIDLYDQAFVLFALSQAYEAEGKPPELLQISLDLLARLDQLLGHPMGGYEESNPRQLPLRSNPHMHLLEALLAWISAGVSSPFRERALAIVDLATSRMIDSATGAIGEYFDGRWQFAAKPEGAIREPGHQFEWAYLLNQSRRILGCDTTRQSLALEAFASRHGVDERRNVAVFSLDDAGVVTDSRARLWAQTERLRASLSLASVSDINAERLRQSALASFSALRLFLSTPTKGLWWEWMASDGTFIDAPAPASSLYHVVSALSELCRM